MALCASTFNRMSRSRLPVVLPRSTDSRFRFIIEWTVAIGRSASAIDLALLAKGYTIAAAPILGEAPLGKNGTKFTRP